jgi:hypothetical protein
MLSPPTQARHLGGHTSNRISEIPCRVSKLPGAGAILCSHPLITAKSHPAASSQGRGDSRRMMSWEVLCLEKSEV